MRDTITNFESHTIIYDPQFIGIENQFNNWMKPSNGVRKAYSNLSEETIAYFLKKFKAKEPITYRNKHESTFLCWLLKRPALTSLLGIEAEIKIIFTRKDQ